MFQRARVKLTIWYLLMIMSVSAMFSFGIYKVWMNEVYRFERTQRLRLEQSLQDGVCFSAEGFPQHQALRLPINTELLDDAHGRVVSTLLLVNLSIFLVAGILGYLAAGKTLQPIKVMVDEQNRFIGDASHELKTPLTSLKTAFEVYQRSSKKSLTEASTLIAESLVEVNKLQHLAEDLLQLAQYDATEEMGELSLLSVKSVATEAVKKVQPLAKKKKIILQNTVTEATVKGNQANLVRVLVILLDNAIKYSQKGAEIQLSSVVSKRLVKIMVTDHGQGIAAADLPYIFDRFYRTDRARTQAKVNGHGLGLAIAQKIISTHRGSITVTSKEKTGTIFTITLPRKT